MQAVLQLGQTLCRAVRMSLCWAFAELKSSGFWFGDYSKFR